MVKQALDVRIPMPLTLTIICLAFFCLFAQFRCGCLCSRTGVKTSIIMVATMLYLFSFEYV